MYERFSHRVSDLPNLGTDWGDVVERLRQHQCCSSCTNARLPAVFGGQSTYDRVVSRMVNQIKWCIPAIPPTH
ncbi:hypothetical protein PG994_003070 [Apiospora phragmitis]|uniref:Uncharacterized protein n=1 Tax=Apiospora phragmitis TaxID=2905665 RepID=A0ABR1WAS6_9PEZI